MPVRVTRPRLGLACAVAIAGTLAGCSTGESGGGTSDRAVYISVPLEGAAGTYGRAIQQGAELARRREAARGDRPRGLRLEVRDDTRDGRWSPVAAADNARAATSDSAAVAYLGEFESGATSSSLPITNEARMLQVSPASTALDLVGPFPGSDEVPELVQPTGERTFGRVIPDDEAQAAAGAAWARRLGARSALVVSDGSGFGDAVSDEFAEEAEALGIAVERAGRRVEAARVARSNPDLVYFGGIADAALPLLERVAGLPDALLMGTDALLLDHRFLRRAQPHESRLRLTASAQDPTQLPPPHGPRFVRRFRATYGHGPDPYAAYGYEAMAVTLDSIERASDPVDRATILDAFFDTRNRDSVLGTYSIDELGNTTLNRLAGYRVRDGRPVFDAGLGAP
ncbi:MAG TPA: branched-chain amino acid ABC transporter substrate-binding protein [Solirubrobacterales bacterium]|nr:branched-chain amino acid ABC transporter substrate-binding protein [Solirubrobacterales bacterium]